MDDISEEGAAELAGFPWALLRWEAGVHGEADGGAQTTALREKIGSAVEVRRFWREWLVKPAALGVKHTWRRRAQADCWADGSVLLWVWGGGVEVGSFVKKDRAQGDKQHSPGMP